METSFTGVYEINDLIKMNKGKGVFLWSFLLRTYNPTIEIYFLSFILHPLLTYLQALNITVTLQCPSYALHFIHYAIFHYMHNILNNESYFFY